MVLFYKIWENCNEIQLTKDKMDNLKMKNYPPSLKKITLNYFYYYYYFWSLTS